MCALLSHWVQMLQSSPDVLARSLAVCMLCTLFKAQDGDEKEKQMYKSSRLKTERRTSLPYTDQSASRGVYLVITRVKCVHGQPLTFKFEQDARLVPLAHNIFVPSSNIRRIIRLPGPSVSTIKFTMTVSTITSRRTCSAYSTASPKSTIEDPSDLAALGSVGGAQIWLEACSRGCDDNSLRNCLGNSHRCLLINGACRA